MTLLGLHEVLLDIVDLRLKLQILKDVVDIAQLLSQLQLKVIPGVRIYTSGRIVDWQVNRVGIWFKLESEDAARS